MQPEGLNLGRRRVEEIGGDGKGDLFHFCFLGLIKRMMIKTE